jgi:hypothetical protein
VSARPYRIVTSLGQPASDVFFVGRSLDAMALDAVVARIRAIRSL